jgi:aspartokinase/homoserine dehydrogenase 1
MNAPIVVTTGFVASTVEGTPTTLKRSGSDYSATIFAKLMAASKARERHRRFLAHTTEPPAKSSARFALAQITMWKNVDGVYTADPRRVPEAFPIESLKYDEAIELAFFGAQARAAHCPDSSSFPQFAAPRAAKHRSSTPGHPRKPPVQRRRQVLHPSAMAPCIEERIPIFVRNIFNPAHPGTVIEGRACSLESSAEAWSVEAVAARAQNRKAACPVKLRDNESPIRGITSVDQVSLVSIEGAQLLGLADVSQRLFGAIREAGAQVPPLLVTLRTRRSIATHVHLPAHLHLHTGEASRQVIMITQASADSSICVVTPTSDAERALRCIEAAFQLELQRKQVVPPPARRRRGPVPPLRPVPPLPTLPSPKKSNRSRRSRASTATRWWQSSARGWPSGRESARRSRRRWQMLGSTFAR